MTEKLQKVLAAQGLGSRREIETWISQGRVSVNGEVAKLGERVGKEDRISVDGRPVAISESSSSRRVLLYNKREGEVCTRSDPEGRATVFDHLPSLKGQRWICVGRLDINTSGLLMFTTDGELANRLMHPSSGIDREYQVRVLGEMDEAMRERLTTGVMLDDGMARFTDIVAGRGEGVNHWYYVVLMEGRNREVRRLWESQGVSVNRLKRVRFGSVFMPSHLKSGQWMEMEQKDIDAVSVLAGMEPVKNSGARLPKERDRVERQRRKLKTQRGSVEGRESPRAGSRRNTKPAGKKPSAGGGGGSSSSRRPRLRGRG